MKIFKHFGIDLNNDTLSQIMDKMNDAGLGNACITPTDSDDKPIGMFLLLNETEAIPDIQKALEEYYKASEATDTAHTACEE